MDSKSPHNATWPRTYNLSDIIANFPSIINSFSSSRLPLNVNKSQNSSWVNMYSFFIVIKTIIYIHFKWDTVAWWPPLLTPHISISPLQWTGLLKEKKKTMQKTKTKDKHIKLKTSNRSSTVCYKYDSIVFWFLITMDHSLLCEKRGREQVVLVELGGLV